MLRFSDERNFARTLAGLSLFAGPLMLLLAAAVSPDLSGDGGERLAEIADNEGRYIASGYLFLLGAWLFVPGLIGLWRLFRGPRGVTLGQVGGGLVLLGVITTIAFFGFGAYEYEMAQPGLDQTQMAELAEQADETEVAIPLFITFLVGVGIGSLIVAWSLWRRQLVPPWSPAAIVVGTIVSAAAEDDAVLAAIGFAFLLIGFGAVGLKLLSMSDDEFDQLGRGPAAAEPPPPPPPPPQTAA
jgi:hypothetical protein